MNGKTILALVVLASLVSQAGAGTYLWDGGVSAQISYEGDLAGGGLTGGNDIVLYDVQVPEPATMGLRAAGLAGLAATRRRRK
jgi:hypothetical protein